MKQMELNEQKERLLMNLKLADDHDFSSKRKNQILLNYIDYIDRMIASFAQLKEKEKLTKFGWLIKRITDESDARELIENYPDLSTCYDTGLENEIWEKSLPKFTFAMIFAFARILFGHELTPSQKFMTML